MTSQGTVPPKYPVIKIEVKLQNIDSVIYKQIRGSQEDLLGERRLIEPEKSLPFQHTFSVDHIVCHFDFPLMVSFQLQEKKKRIISNIAWKNIPC